MKVGDVTEVLRTQRGYQILKLESRTETKIRSFDEARGDISNKVGEPRNRAASAEIPRTAARPGHDHWRNDELKKAYEQALAERRKVAGGMTLRQLRVIP